MKFVFTWMGLWIDKIVPSRAVKIHILLERNYTFTKMQCSVCNGLKKLFLPPFFEKETANAVIANGVRCRKMPNDFLPMEPTIWSWMTRSFNRIVAQVTQHVNYSLYCKPNFLVALSLRGVTSMGHRDLVI